jgi:hypothetical protein
MRSFHTAQHQHQRPSRSIPYHELTQGQAVAKYILNWATRAREGETALNGLHYPLRPRTEEIALVTPVSGYLAFMFR